MLPLIRLLKKYNFPALPEDREKAQKIAGRDDQGKKGRLIHDAENVIPLGVYARGLVGLVKKMPLLERQPEDDDYIMHIEI